MPNTSNNSGPGRKDYTRARGTSFFSGLLFRHAVLFGPDHLLLVEDRIYSESYKRFYYSDIQCVLVRKDERWLFSTIVFSVVFGIGLWLVLWGWGFATFFFILALLIFGFGAFGLIMNVIGGKSCKCYIVTPIQRQLLPSLERLKNVDTFIKDLSERIDRFQQPLESVPSVEVIQQTSAAKPVVPAAKQNFEIEIKKDYRGGMHLALFLLALIIGIYSFIGFFGPFTLTFIALSAALVSLLVAFCIIALIIQKYTEVSRDVGRGAWSVLIYLVVVSIVGFAFYPYIGFRYLTMTDYNPYSLTRLAQPPLSTDMVLHTAVAIYGIIAAIIGIYGIVVTANFMRQKLGARPTQGSR